MAGRISPERYAAAQRQTIEGAKLALARWLWLHPRANLRATMAETLRLIDRFGAAAARLACVFYMDQRRGLGVVDNWRIIPSDGEHPDRLVRLIVRAWDPEAELHGLGWVLDLGVSAYERRTMQRRRGGA